ncbi:hypothetical protein [Novosphingobium sp. NDB2Meth1]|uniref:DUF7946 domain-containing protein n=1 Tax=Novosphingobium sp. NDB2Meth1 TaxID=1892847 RepID=UPI000930CE0D|nr:hypothetical protein [Novosphingobium sp. NDB2Meth1]
MAEITLSYTGNLTDNNTIDLYDAARALVGFQRSLALTTHLLLNGEIITQAPSLQGAKIITTPPEEGSWKVTATILVGIWTVGTAPKDSVFGHLLYSAYDLVVKETLGFHVDFSKSLGQQHEEYLASKKITKEKMDSLVEKTEAAISDMHRPIVGNRTATSAKLIAYPDKKKPIQLGPELTEISYQYISHTVKSPKPSQVVGVVSSYNSNTFKGRIYSFDEKRPIPFELEANARNRDSINLITASLRSNAVNRSSTDEISVSAIPIMLTCHRLESATGRLKGLVVTAVSPTN